jgi:hypothetical protein
MYCVHKFMYVHIQKKPEISKTRDQQQKLNQVRYESLYQYIRAQVMEIKLKFTAVMSFFIPYNYTSIIVWISEF